MSADVDMTPYVGDMLQSLSLQLCQARAERDAERARADSLADQLATALQHVNNVIDTPDGRQGPPINQTD